MIRQGLEVDRVARNLEFARDENVERLRPDAGRLELLPYRLELTIRAVREEHERSRFDKVVARALDRGKTILDAATAQPHGGMASS